MTKVINQGGHPSQFLTKWPVENVTFLLLGQCLAMFGSNAI